MHTAVHFTDKPAVHGGNTEGIHHNIQCAFDLRSAIISDLQQDEGASPIHQRNSGSVQSCCSPRSQHGEVARHYDTGRGANAPRLCVNHPAANLIVDLSWTAVSRLSVHGLQIWFGISNYTRFGTYLERRMRSHPLVLDMGNGTLPSTEASPAVRMLDLDASYQQLANAEGAQVYKAADWRYVPLLYHHHKSVPFEGPLPSNRLSCRP